MGHGHYPPIVSRVFWVIHDLVLCLLGMRRPLSSFALCSLTSSGHTSPSNNNEHWSETSSEWQTQAEMRDWATVLWLGVLGTRGGTNEKVLWILVAPVHGFVVSREKGHLQHTFTVCGGPYHRMNANASGYSSEENWPIRTLIELPASGHLWKVGSADTE